MHYLPFNAWLADNTNDQQTIAQNEILAEVALDAAADLENRAEFELAQEAMDYYLYFIDNPGVLNNDGI